MTIGSNDFYSLITTNISNMSYEDDYNYCSLLGRNAGVMHFGNMCLSVCLSWHVTQKLLLRMTRFFRQKIVCPWLGPPLR